MKTTHLVIVFIYFVHQSFNDIHLYIAYNKVMQVLRNKYPAFSSLISIAEHSKKETSSISRNTSTLTSGTNVQLIKIKVKMLNAREVVPWRTRTYGFSRLILLLIPKVNPFTFVLFKFVLQNIFYYFFI